MSYTREEYLEIAANVEVYREAGKVDVFYEDTTGELRRQEVSMSELRKEQLFNIVSELYRQSDGIHTQDKQTERIPF